MQPNHKSAADGQILIPKATRQPARNPFKGLSVIKWILLTGIAFLIVNVANAQKALKITQMREVTWNSYTQQWTPWPTSWRTYEAGNEPVLVLTRLDDSGYNFQVDIKIKDKNFSFTVSFEGYDDNNKWYKYKDQNNDEINIVGSTMSKLSVYGWPDTTVDIYFWIYTKSMALELE